MTPPRRPRLPLLIIPVAAAVVAIDQLTKTLALTHLDPGRPVPVVWTLQLNLSFNTGAAFSLGRGLTPFLVAAGLVLLAALVVMARRVTAPSLMVALALVIGGAAGNLTDRLVRGHGGAVVDFIDLQWWPIFNVADAAISVGAVLLVILAARAPADGEGADDAEAEGGPVRNGVV